MKDLSSVQQFIDSVQHLRVAVVGETIIDEFIDVSYEGQSMKSFCPVFSLKDNQKRIQQGGAAAIANHLKSFVKELTFLTNENNEIVKSRLVDVNSAQKHVEINKFETQGFGEIDLRNTDYDVLIVADFGHGFCDQLKLDDGFHLMCQTNSNNFGFNRMSKWKSLRKKSIALDLREASLQINKKMRRCTDDQAIDIFKYEMSCDDLFITLGGEGALYTNGEIVARHKGLKTEIVDTIGAGDTFFAFACLASHINMPSDEILSIPNLAASLSTTWLCNESSVTPKSLIEHAAQYIQ